TTVVPAKRLASERRGAVRFFPKAAGEVTCWGADGTFSKRFWGGRMGTPQPIPLTAVRTVPGEPEYQALLGGPFAAQPFYEGQVIRLLQHDIPHRVMYSFGLVWYYRDSDGNTVGFGTLDVCKDYERFTGGKHHCYIPLLAVNPAFQKRGHGRSIIEHLIGEAVLITQSPADFS